ncbi:Hsp70 family protein [Paractinoplanes atraurantiacus]|uniref:PQQ-like domain-containing protein n=1 Tax=Paractinoplanes atraurantiacus TaxID=1036182 RepID=A0A285F046_9ACTN|nr:Hsp70 family protein [Actinoplanes atraurantiacus]SNY04652.1 PQQ-like domain-containing protein [Actinoplanes atraurantiacus]
MTDGFVLGVDLGTSHTVAMLRRPDGRTRPLLFDGRPLLPSAVFLDPTGRLHVGADALRLGQADPGRLEPHPKRHVDEESVMLGDGATVPVADLLAALLDAVAREAVATAGFLPPAVVTYPASWGARRRAVLTRALSQAGWPSDTLGQPAETTLVTEPVAAARYFADVLRRPLPEKSSLAVFDFGGGTLDVAVVRRDGGSYAATASGGASYSVTASGGADDLGGLDIDAALVDHLGKSLSGAEPAAWQALTEPVTLAQWRARRQFWEDVRGAKEMLSRSSFAPVPVPGVEEAVHLTRDELEAAADPLIRRGVSEAAAVIAAAGLSPIELAGLFLVGGSSRVPLVARLLHSELGIAPTVLEQPELAAAEGATLAAALRYAAGVSTAATPTPTPTTAPDFPPPITDTQAASTPVDPISPAAGPPAATASAGPPNAAASAGLPDVASRSAGPAASPATGPPTSPAARPFNPDSDPPYSTDKTDERESIEAVDPWATAEAAAIAAGHVTPTSATPSSAAPWQPPAPPPTYSPEAPPAAKSAKRRTWIIAGAATLAVVLAAGTALAWTLWPRYPALDYHPLADLQHLPAAVPIGSSWSDAAVIGDRVYFASTDYDTGDLGVVAFDDGAKSAAWSQKQTGIAKRWRQMVALPSGVALFSDTDLDKDTREVVVLDAGKGAKRWQRTVGRDDLVYFAGDHAIVADRAGRRLVGLKLEDGSEDWTRPDPGDSTSATAVHVVTTPGDLDGPAGLTGRPFDADLGDDPRLVQITPDREARLIDAGTGKVIASRQSVAGPDDEVVAHNGRLFVREDEDADRIVTYQLDKLGEPDVTYTAGSATARLTGLIPCGDDRVCAIEGTGYGDDNATVVALDAAEGGKVWERKVAKAETLVPVGEAVLARSTAPETTLIDATGKQIWTGKSDAVRLDAANILEFSKPLVGYVDDPAVAGRHLGDDPVQLGPLQGVRTSSCAWNTTLLACVADKDFVVTSFAG